MLYLRLPDKVQSHDLWNMVAVWRGSLISAQDQCMSEELWLWQKQELVHWKKRCEMSYQQFASLKCIFMTFGEQGKWTAVSKSDIGVYK